MELWGSKSRVFDKRAHIPDLHTGVGSLVRFEVVLRRRHVPNIVSWF